MSANKNLKKIVITGPESTGKTELSINLAEKLGAVWIPEYAREYVEKLPHKYTYQDIEAIACMQIMQEKIYEKKASGFLIFDTWLILTKVWFDLVYGKCPDWVISYIKSTQIDLFLVCSTDIPWIPDLVRENGGKKREQLFDLYCYEIGSFGFKYSIVRGIGGARLENALNALNQHQLIQ